jgi:molybdopterin converting factor small subunit
METMEIDLPDGSSLTWLYEGLGLAYPLEALILVVNGRAVQADQVLVDGDCVHLIPAITGG